MASTLFKQILVKVKQCFASSDLFGQIRTQKGNTQTAERIYISCIRKILNEMGLTFKEAGSQQPYDFRINIPDSEDILKLEAKKTDSFNIYFNDTCPTEEAYYMIFFTGKVYKTKDSIPARILGVNGSVFTAKCPWIKDYASELSILKEKYRHMSGNMSVYPRPTYKSDIRFLIEAPGDGGDGDGGDGDERERQAIINYNLFHGHDPGRSTIAGVKASSAGVEGWAAWRPDIKKEEEDQKGGGRRLILKRKFRIVGDKSLPMKKDT
jgi:hypothetical protein